MVTGPDLSSQREVSVSMETDQLSGNLLLFMHCPGGEGQEREGRVGRDGLLVCVHLHIKAQSMFRINPVFENDALEMLQ